MKFGDWKVGEVYIIDDEITVMCIGIDDLNCYAVLAPFYAEDEDLQPDLHVKDGVEVYNMFEEYDNIEPLQVSKTSTTYRIFAETVST